MFRLLFPPCLLPTTNSQRQEIRGQERKEIQSASLKDRTNVRILIDIWDLENLNDLLYIKPVLDSEYDIMN